MIRLTTGYGWAIVRDTRDYSPERIHLMPGTGYASGGNAVRGAHLPHNWLFCVLP